MWYINYKTNEEVTTMRKELLKGLSEQQIKKVKECKSSEEILALAKAEGVQLSDEQLEAVSGGSCSGATKCPECRSKNLRVISENVGGDPTGKIKKYKCRDCGREFEAL